jgi:sucrose-6-phosphate hydrolase SacC (GH32 family)
MQWVRHPDSPVHRDTLVGENYEVASDPHVFYDSAGGLWMVYTGDEDGRPAIKLAKGQDPTDWSFTATLLSDGAEEQSYRETPFYYQGVDGRHYLYYIGYPEETSYRAQLFRAVADRLQGPYRTDSSPLIAAGLMAGQEVYSITSPSVVEHGDTLFLSFIGWNDAPDRVTEVWTMGATSTDGGQSWSEVRSVNVPIGMEGQITRAPDGTFVAVRTGEHAGGEAIFYATADHPFGPWRTSEVPIVEQAGPPLETDEIIAPQITFEADTGAELLYYTGAEHAKGWWVMLAQRR